MEFIDNVGEENGSVVSEIKLNVLPKVRQILRFKQGKKVEIDTTTTKLIDFLRNGAEGEVIFDEQKQT